MLLKDTNAQPFLVTDFMPIAPSNGS